MKQFVRRFVAVGIVATLVDIGGYALLREGLGWSIVGAELVALPVAGLTSFVLHRMVTLRGDPYQRWMHQPAVFVSVGLVAGVIDLVVLLLLGGAVWAKVVAVAVASIVRFAAHRMLLFRAVRSDQQAPSRRPLPASPVALSVVVPAYREADRIGATVDTLRQGLGPDPVEIVVVDDGSDDGTAEAAAGADKVVVQSENRGKGAAVRAGMLAATGSVRAFVDADLAYGPEVVRTLADAVNDGWDVAVGNRRHVATRTLVRAGRLRELGGRLVNLTTQALLLGQYRDTQCGVKALRGDVADSLFARTTIDGFAFDIELFHLVERDRLSLIEVPVTVTNSSRSTVHIARDTARLLRDLWRIRVASRTGAYEYSQSDMADLDAIFKAYDIRGTVPDQLDADTSRAIGAAFGRFLADTEAATEVVLAHDMRPTGPEYVAAFADGVMGQGVDVVHMGLASTDMLYFASGHLGLPGAVFTASHNPAEYNGIKMCRAQAAPIGADTGLDTIKEMARAGLEPAATTGGAREVELLDAFADHVRSFVDVAGLRPLKVVADTANGMGGLVAPAVFSGLPIDIEILYPELDGTFPNHPADPIQPENQADLIARLLEVGADVGLAFDGDADRVFLVDENGRPVSGSLTTALVASRVLAKEPGATVLHNLICSKAVPEVVAEAGGTAVRTKVGHSYIKADMAETGAAFAGEHSGHYYFRDNWRADSGLIASMFVLEAMSDTGQSLASLLEPVDRYVASGEINTRVADTSAVIEKVAAHYGDLGQDRLDGLTVDAGDWWFNLRPSNTEPLLRLNLEAPDQVTCDAKVAEVRSLFT